MTDDVSIFHVLICYLCIFFGEVSKFFAHLKNGLLIFSLSFENFYAQAQVI